MLLQSEAPVSHVDLAQNPYQPHMARIVRIYRMVEDNHLFTFRFLDDRVATEFHHKPGQFLMLSVPGTGEAPISISSSPTRPGILELCIRRVGRVTNPWGVPEERDVPIWVARGEKETLQTLWPSLGGHE